MTDDPPAAQMMSPPSLRRKIQKTTFSDDRQHGIALHLVDMGGQSVNTGSSMGKMMLTMLAGFAEFERNMIAERTTAALTYKRRSGEVYNHVPYGYRASDGRLVADAAEQAVIARMATLRSGGTSYNEIANALNAHEVPTKQGGIWRSQTVKNILSLRGSAAIPAINR